MFCSGLVTIDLFPFLVFADRLVYIFRALKKKKEREELWRKLDELSVKKRSLLN